MRSVTKDNITEVFASYFGEDTDPRVKEVLSALARHMHDFAREVNLTHEEWQVGIEFLTRAGEITIFPEDYTRSGVDIVDASFG